MDAKEIIGELENSTGIWPLTLCLEASDLQKPGFGVDCLHRWRKEEKTGARKNATHDGNLTQNRGKTIRKNATHEGNLGLKKGSRGTGGTNDAGVLCFTGKRVLGMVFA